MSNITGGSPGPPLKSYIIIKDNIISRIILSIIELFSDHYIYNRYSNINNLRENFSYH